MLTDLFILTDHRHKRNSHASLPVLALSDQNLTIDKGGYIGN